MGASSYAKHIKSIHFVRKAKQKIPSQYRIKIHHQTNSKTSTNTVFL